MIYFKLLGSLVILLVGGIGALGSIRYERRRLRVLDGWIDMIHYIRGQIDCYLTPLDEILDTFVPTDTPADLTALYNASLLYLDAEAKKLLFSFVREIGGGYREEQLRHCDFCIAELRRRREKISGELPMRQQLAVTLCVCLSVGTAILLW